VSGEQLPPVVARLDGNDDDFLSMWDRDIAAVRSGAAEIESILASLDLGAGLSASLSGADLGSLNSDEIAQALGEQMGGVGAALAEDVGTELDAGLAAAGLRGGEALAEGIAEGAGAAGDVLAQDLVRPDQLADSLEAAGAQAAAALEEGFSSELGSLGSEVGEQISGGLAPVHDQAGAEGAGAGHALAAGIAAGLAALPAEGIAAGAALAAAIGVGGVSEAESAAARISEAIAEPLNNALRGAGRIAGAMLTASVQAGGTGTGEAAAASIAESIGEPFEGAIAAQGTSGGGALIDAVRIGAVRGAEAAAARTADAVGEPLSNAMSAVGSAAGGKLIEQFALALEAGSSELDAVAVSIQSRVAASAGSASASVAAEVVEQVKVQAPQVAEEVGASLGDALEQGVEAAAARASEAMSTSSVDWRANVAKTQQDYEDFASGKEAQAPPDPMIPNILQGNGSSWIRASKLGAQQAAEAAWIAYREELTALVITPEQFEALTDAGIEGWTEQVRAQAEVSGAGFVSAFADAITMGMVGLDWGSLTGAQVDALSSAMRGTLTSTVASAVEAESEQVAEALAQQVEQTATAVEEMQALVASTGSPVADGLIARIVEARQAVTEQLVELAVEAGEEGAEAGGRFAQFFSEAVAGVRLVLGQDPEAAAEEGAQAGRDYANAVVDQLETELGGAQAVVAEEGAAAGNAFGRFFSGAAAAALAVFAEDPAAAAGAAAGVEFAEGMVAQLEARLAVLSDAGGEGFAQAVEQQLEVQLQLAAAQATEAYEQELTAGLAAAEAAAAEQAGSADVSYVLFQSISQGGRFLSDNLATAMTQALTGIEADTSAFTAQELAQWQLFFATLEAEGDQAAAALARSMGSLQGQDLLAMNLGTTGAPLKQAASDIEGVDAAAAHAGASVGGLGGHMGMLQMAAFSLIGYLPQVISSLSTLSGVGDHTALGVGNVEAAILGLSDTTLTGGTNLQVLEAGLVGLSNISGGHWSQGLQDIGTALAQLYQSDPELAAEQFDALTKSMQAQGMSASQIASDLGAYTTEVQNAQIQLEAERQAILDDVPGTNAFSTAVETATVQMQQQAQQALVTADAQQNYLNTVIPGTLSYSQAVYEGATSLQYQARQQAISAAAQQQYLALLVPGTDEYVQAVQSASEALSANTVTARINAEALNAGLAGQSMISQAAINASVAYTQAQQATNAYTGALNALYGQYGSTTAAEATFTTDLDGLAGTITSGKDAVDQYTAAGAKNITAFQGVSQQALTVAGDIYQQTGSTQQADAALQKMAGQLDTAAGKAHLTAGQIQQLNLELFGVKNLSDLKIDITADPGPAEQAVAQLISRINSSSGTVTIYENTSGGVTSTDLPRGQQARASGGPVQGGVTYTVGEQGIEQFTPATDGYVTAHAALGSSSGGGGPAVVHNHFHIDGSLIHESDLSDLMRTDTLQFQQRTSYSGLAYG
jgi:hypothetical protein